MSRWYRQVGVKHDGRRQDSDPWQRRVKIFPAYACCSAEPGLYKRGTLRSVREIGDGSDKVQYQKGLSEAEFERRYGSEEQCRAAVARWRWPDGFVCPHCGGRRHSVIKTRALYQCTACRRQTSLTAGTIFAATKLALRSWFRALYHLTQSKQAFPAWSSAAVSASPRRRRGWSSTSSSR